MASPPADATSTEETVARLAPLVRGDPVLNNVLASGWLRLGGVSVSPSGLDLVACALARAVITNARSVALAVPRGRSSLSLMLGIYLAAHRVVARRLGGHISGSVAVSTFRTDLRELARGLVFDGTELDDAIPIARLVTQPLANRKVRAAALTLNTRSRRGISQNDSYLLFMLPNRMPPVALNVISAMVCDTFGASPTSWRITRERNVAASRREVWIGELGNVEFEEFCEAESIPLLRLDWPVIAAAADGYGVGLGKMATVGVCQRALESPPVSYRVVEHADVDEELRLLTFALAEMRRVGRDEAPEPMRDASQLANLLARLACPVDFYERAVASHPMSRKVSWLLERISDARSSTFRNRFSRAFEQYWPTVKGASRELARTLANPDECPKFWAVQERLVDLGVGEQLRIVCQTRAERDALHDALLDGGLVKADELDGGRITVSSFSERGEQGPAGKLITLLCAPPPPAKAGIYLSGEAGLVEVLCYPFEVARLRSAMKRVNEQFSGARANQAALDALRYNHATGTPPQLPPAPEPSELIGYGERRAPSHEVPGGARELPGADAGFWESAEVLYDVQLPLGDEQDDNGTQDGGGDAGPGLARLVTFSDGPAMFLADSAACTVVVAPERAGGEPDVVTMSPGELTAGMRIALLPGSERGGLLAELMAAWDEGLALVHARYEPLYNRALAAAIETHGVDGIADAVGLTPAAVRAWRDGRAWPGLAATLRRLLELSGDEEALRNQALIQDYFSRVRGAHRYIGRVLNDAVGETVLHTHGHDSIRKLEKLVGRDLTDLFDATSVLTVQTVGEPKEMPAGVCGFFLDASDPYLKSKGALQ